MYGLSLVHRHPKSISILYDSEIYRSGYHSAKTIVGDGSAIPRDAGWRSVLGVDFKSLFLRSS